MWDLSQRELQMLLYLQTFLAGIDGLRPSPTDTCSLWLNNASVAALPLKCSRHNTPTRSHSLSKVVKACYAGGDEFVVVIVYFIL